MLPYNASPKAISRRTSYLQVRLAFHRYPQVIRACCNALRYGPPRSFTCASACPWIDHLVSGLIHITLVALFRLAFTAPPSNDLGLLYELTRWIVLQKAPRHGLIASDETHLSDSRFQMTKIYQIADFRLFCLLPVLCQISAKCNLLCLLNALRLRRARSESLYAHNFRFYFTPLPGFF